MQSQLVVYAGNDIWSATITAAGPVLIAIISAIPLAVRSVRKRRQAELADRPPIMLPSRIRLVDRTNEVFQVLRHLRDGEFVIAIEGNLGVGKSAVAAEVAHRMVDRVTAENARPSRRHAKYRWLAWIDAQNNCPTVADLARHFSLLSGDQGMSAAPDADKANALRAFLARQPSIIVVDNVRLTAVAAQEFIGFIRTIPTGSLAIVSANTPGRMAAPRILVEELQQDFMRELLRREAQRLDVKTILSADQATLDRAYALVGGNPRAIELLVLTCSRRPVTLREVVDELSVGQGNITDELYASVWESLAEEHRLTIIACAYLCGRALADQLSAALDIPWARLSTLVEVLWADGLLSALEQERSLYYTCSQVLRVFALNKAPDELLRSIRRRLARHFIDWFTDDWEDAEGAIPHIPVIRTLIEDLFDHGDHVLSLDLFDVTLDIFFTLGLFDDRIRLGWVAYNAATRLDDPVRQSVALSVVSSTHSLRGEHEPAARAIELGIEAARRAGSDKEMARQIRCRGYNEFRRGAIAEALDVIDGAEEMAVTAGDPHNAVDILALRSAAEWHLGRFAECKRTVDRFLYFCEQIPWERGKAYPIREKAELAIMERSFSDAGLLLAESRSIAEEYRDQRQLVRIGLSESRLLLHRRRMISARRRGRTVSDTAERLGLTGEMSEADAVVRAAIQTILLPWKRYSYFRNPRNRFTSMTIGGD